MFSDVGPLNGVCLPKLKFFKLRAFVENLSDRMMLLPKKNITINKEYCIAIHLYKCMLVYLLIIIHLLYKNGMVCIHLSVCQIHKICWIDFNYVFHKTAYTTWSYIGVFENLFKDVGPFTSKSSYIKKVGHLIPMTTSKVTFFQRHVIRCSLNNSIPTVTISNIIRSPPPLCTMLRCSDVGFGGGGAGRKTRPLAELGWGWHVKRTGGFLLIIRNN